MGQQKLPPQPKNPSISVLMAVYAGTNPAYFDCAFASILRQTHPAHEIVIVFDGPIPDPVEQSIDKTAKNVTSPPIKVVRCNNNKGLGHALHEGVAACSGEFILRMDDDDISVPDRIALQVETLRADGDIDVLGGQIIELRNDSAPKMRSVPLAHDDIKRGMQTRNRINHVTVLMRRATVVAAGNYDTTIRAGFEDYELWHRMLFYGAMFKNIDRTLVIVRFDHRQISRRSGIAYLYEEWNIHHHFWQAGYTTTMTLLTAMLMRVIPRLLPKFMMSFIYDRALRQPLNKEQHRSYLNLLKDYE